MAKFLGFASVTSIVTDSRVICEDVIYDQLSALLWWKLAVKVRFCKSLFLSKVVEFITQQFFAIWNFYEGKSIVNRLVVATYFFLLQWLIYSFLTHSELFCNEMLAANDLDFVTKTKVLSLILTIFATNWHIFCYVSYLSWLLEADISFPKDIYNKLIWFFAKFLPKTPSCFYVSSQPQNHEKWKLVCAWK